MNTSLLRALRTVERADSDPTRTVLFESLAARSRAIRLARTLTQGAWRGSYPAALAVAAYGLVTARVCTSPPGRPLWALPLFENDRRQLQRVATTVGPRYVGRSGTGWRAVGALLLAVSRSAWTGSGRRFVRLVRRLCRRHGFLVSCRTASALACAMVADRSLRESRPRALRGVLVSSDYNAEAVGLCQAARRAGLVTIYAAHAPVHHLSPPLDFSLSIVDGEAALDAYRKKGPIGGRCVLRGVEGRERPLVAEALTRSQPVIGVFLPKETDWRVFRTIVEEARRAFQPRSVLVRWHPNALERAAEAVTGVESCPSGATLDEDAQRCDWVIADWNSSVPLTVLKAGVPVVVVPGLAVFPSAQADLYGLVANAVVPPPRPSLRELDTTALAGFYGAGWPDRFRHFDASYQRRPGDLESQVRSAVLEVAGLSGGVP